MKKNESKRSTTLTYFCFESATHHTVSSSHCTAAQTPPPLSQLPGAGHPHYNQYLLCML